MLEIRVKSLKVFIAEAGLLHALLNLPTHDDLASHPKVGASWEGFALSEVLAHLGAHDEEVFFWATHAGAELDLLVRRGRTRLGFAFKRTSAPRTTRSMRTAVQTLKLDRLDVVHAGERSFQMADKIRAVALKAMCEDIERL